MCHTAIQKTCQISEFLSTTNLNKISIFTAEILQLNIEQIFLVENNRIKNSEICHIYIK